MLMSHTAWLPFWPTVDQPRQAASASPVRSSRNSGWHHRRLGLHLTRHSHLARIPFCRFAKIPQWNLDIRSLMVSESLMPSLADSRGRQATSLAAMKPRRHLS